MGLGRKVFTRERLTSADVNGYLMAQSVMTFATAAVRTSELPDAQVEEGMISYLEDVGRYYYATADGGPWASLGPKHHGARSSFPTVAADGLVVGDTVERTDYRCLFIYTAGTGDSSKLWRQLTVALVDDRAMRVGLPTTSLHDGFIVHELTGNRRYSWDGVSSWIAEAGPTQAPITSTSGFWTFGTAWDVTTSEIRDLGHGFAFLNVMVTRTTSAVTVPANGDITNTTVCTLAGAQSKWLPVTGFPMTNADNGRVAHGIFLGTGALVLSSVAPGSNIAIGDTIQLSGVYRLADPSAQT